MKLLKDILYKVRIEKVIGATNIAVESIAFDSRKVERLGLFVAIKGTNTDGHKYISDAVEKGAAAIVCEQLPEILHENVTYIQVSNASEALGYIAANFYDNPSEKIKLVGVTGTNGKTSVVTLLHQLFTQFGEKCGMLSTVKNLIRKKEIPATHTTPDPVTINRLMQQMIEEGCKYCFMEVSSHALHQHRVTGLDFDIAVFTNISHDHLDYHKTFKDYLYAKKQLFDTLSPFAHALINADDKNVEIIVQNTKAKVHTYGLKSMVEFKAKIIEKSFEGLLLQIDGQEVWVKLTGSFNAYNVLAVYATARLFNKEKFEVLTNLSLITPPEGRFQLIKSDSGVIGIVDYAHTPDALQNVLDTINDIRTGNEQLITVVGCGGNRDKEKRPLMAKIAVVNSSQVILTSDNPRDEDPYEILEDMQKGLSPVDIKKTLVIENRKEAIKTAASLAKPGDVILVAGKGHEKYQEIKGVKHPFDDYQTLKDFLEN